MAEQDHLGERMHYGVVGMKYGVRKSNRYSKSANRHQQKADALQSKADAKRKRGMNTTNRRIKYAKKEREHTDAENFYNKNALGLSYISKLFGSTLDYSYNKSLAGQNAIMKEKYSQAKSGTTNSVNRIEYRAERERAKAETALVKKKVNDPKVSGATKEEINKMLNSELGSVIVPKTKIENSSVKDKKRVF